jgi:Ras-related protein Rab-18
MCVTVYDVTRRETIESLEEIWLPEVDMYATVDNAIKLVVGNKVDKVRVLRSLFSSQSLCK